MAALPERCTNALQHRWGTPACAGRPFGPNGTRRGGSSPGRPSSESVVKPRVSLGLETITISAGLCGVGLGAQGIEWLLKGTPAYSLRLWIFGPVCGILGAILYSVHFLTGPALAC